MIKKTFLLLIISVSVFAQSPQRRNFTDGNPNQLILFENTLPPKKYDYNTSDLQVQWHVLLLDFIEQTTGYTPLVTARTFAYVNLAAYEAIVPTYPQNISLSGQLQGYTLPKEFVIDSAGYIPQVAINNAIFTMVNKMFFVGTI